MQKTILFWDNDGVPVDTEALYFEANRQVLRGLGVELTVRHFREFYLEDTTGGWHLVGGLSDAAIEEKRGERNRIYAEMLSTRSFAVPGALFGRFAMGVVTSSRRDHLDLIYARTGFGRFFEVVVTGDDLRRTKPDPEPCLRALELAGRVPGDRGLRARARGSQGSGARVLGHSERAQPRRRLRDCRPGARQPAGSPWVARLLRTCGAILSKGQRTMLSPNIQSVAYWMSG
jgi:phosphoglycolate phosphatase-like HAD superfamily hydrolase